MESTKPPLALTAGYIILNPDIKQDEAPDLT